MIMPERAPSGAPSPQPNETPPPHGLADNYAALEQTLCDSTIGRWFLAEHARRTRAPEIQLLLDAIARLEGAVLHNRAGAAGILAELACISETIGRMRRDIAELNPLHRTDQQQRSATEGIGQIVDTGNRATYEILSAAEDVQRVSWSLRETGALPEFCDRLDARTVDIHIACVSQDIAGQKTAKVVHMLNEVDQRIHAMIRLSSAEDTAHGAGSGDRREAHKQPPRPGVPDGLPDPARRHAPNLYAQNRHAPDRHAQNLHAQNAEQSDESGLGGGRFARPEPLSLPELDAIKRSTLG